MSIALEQSISGLFGAGVAVAVLPVTGAHPPLLPIEEVAMRRAVPSRRAEFTAGRAAARLALQRLGLPPAAIPSAPDRSPVWPAGVTGSISHAAGLCVAVLLRDPAATLGLDIEEATPLDEDLWPLVLTPSELLSLDTHPPAQRGRIAKRIFSIKEAAYKAQFPLTGAVIGFQALEVTPDFTTHTAQICCTDIGAQVPGLAALFPPKGAACQILKDGEETTPIFVAGLELRK
ncbi:4'-phosphopantetheinyl transferase family protein [Seohaeicola saemankumensis]|uniref:4'-phosphopantetheinyl transferase family protein n=1 Tax=Seohaeicola saemankumensis TaxID=481181 RepID=UPI001E612C05|nr:4'-phosphopantetheinyl transferase superfamily protein [Seohaeicola saemankumensis]